MNVIMLCYKHHQLVIIMKLLKKKQFSSLEDERFLANTYVDKIFEFKLLEIENTNTFLENLLVLFKF